MLRAAVVVCLLLSTANASEPVKKTVTGCVAKGAFYLTNGGRAYRFSIDKLDLGPFEGNSITMSGSLMPGDRFILDDGTKPTVTAETCPTESLRPIKRDEQIELRVAAHYAAKAGDFAKAVELSNQSMAVITPPDCDTFVDRAIILIKTGDLRAAKADLAVVKAKKCYVEKELRMNFVLLEDLGKAFVAKGEKKSAITAFELGLAACDSDICKPDLKKALAAAKRMKK